MSKVEYRGEVRFEDGPWIGTGRFDSPPTVADLRSKAWNVASSRPRGTPLPVEVRRVRITTEAGSAYPFQDGGPS